MDTNGLQADAQQQGMMPGPAQIGERDLDKDAVRREKQQQWDHVMRYYEQVTDALGKKIDADILETVVALNALGINTTASCAGHLDWGTGAPWVDVAAPGTEEEDKRADAATALARKQRQLGVLPETEIRQLFEQSRRLRREVKQKHLEVRRKLMDYLASFYQDRMVSNDRRLIVYGLVSEARLESQGAAVLPLLTQEERQQTLHDYQDEIMDLTHFLKEQFFSCS